MNPLKVKDQAKGYAREKGYDEQDMQDIVDFFYTRLWEYLRNLECLNISMPGIGKWRFMTSMLPKAINDYTHKVLYSRTDVQLATNKHLLGRFQYIRKMSEVRNEKIKRVAQIRKEYEERKSKGEPWTDDDRRRAYTYRSVEQILKDREDRGTLPPETEGMPDSKLWQSL